VTDLVITKFSRVTELIDTWDRLTNFSENNTTNKKPVVGFNAETT